MKDLLRGTGLIIISLVICMDLSGQQNPFDVYRSSNPNPLKSNLNDYRTPKAKSKSFEQVEESDEPERLAAISPILMDSSSEDVGNPFDVYSRRDDPLTPIPNPLRARTEHLTENLAEKESLIIPTIKEKEPGKAFNNPPEVIHKELDKNPNGNSEVLINPFDISDSSNALDLISDERPEVNSEKEYNIDAVENKPAHAVEISLPKDKKVKGYFNNILTNYVFWILLGFLVLLTFVININRKLIPEISKSLISDNYLRITYREYNKGFTQFVSYLLYLNFFVQAGLFAYLVQKPLLGDFTWPWYYFIGGVTGVYLVRHLVLWLLGSFFPVHRETSQFSFVIMQFNLFLGLILFGLNWLLAFGTTGLSKPLIFTGLGAILLLYLIRQFRGLLLGARIVSHYKFHFFLYLCAVEFAPLLILYKVISESFS